jgi:predicted PurR-regulated permease PerM
MNTSQGRRVETGVLIALAVIAILLVLWMMNLVMPVIVLILVATVFAAGIDPLVTRLSEINLPGGRHLPRALAILFILLAALLVLVAIGSYIGFVIYTEGSQLVQDIPNIAANFENWFAGVRDTFPFIPQLDELGPEVQDQIGNIAAYAVQTTAAVFGVLGTLFSALTVVVLTFYLLNYKEDLSQSFQNFIPPQHREKVMATVSEAGQRMGGWLRGQLILGGVVTAIISILMWVLGMPYPLLIGLIGGIGELVPLLGPFVAGLVSVPIALVTQPTWVVIVLVVFFLVFSQVESNFLMPMIMGSQVHLKSITTIIALLIGGSLLGVLGALLAIPVTAALRIFMIRLVIPAVKRAYGQPPEETPEVEADGDQQEA